MAETHNNPFGLSMEVTHADGSTTRWGSDETDPENVPGDTEFTTSMPGGFGDLQSPLLRRIDKDYPDQNLLDNVTLLGPGNEVAFDGRMAQFPRSHGDQFQVTAGAEGWVAHLRDDETFSTIYVDRDLNGWGDVSAARRITLLGANYRLETQSVAPDTATGLPALILTYQRTGDKSPIVESAYDAGPGNLIGSVYYDWTSSNILAQTGDANYAVRIESVSDDAFANQTALATLNATATSGSGTLSLSTARRYLVIQNYYDSATASAAGTDRATQFRKVTIYGDHGLTVQGTAPGGFYGGDVIAHALGETCPLLTYTTGTGGSIEPGSYVIPHLVFRDPTTAETVIRKVTDYEGKEWGVYEDRQLFWRDPDPDRCCWQARLSEGAKPSFDGPSGVTLLNGVFVTYRDPAGTTHTVGPPGSNAETTDTLLADSSSTNPATAIGVRKWAVLNIDEPTTEAGAIEIGSLWLADRLSPQRRGSVTLTGMVKHPTEGPRPAWRVRAGDYVQITDSGNTAQRRVIDTRYSHPTRSVTCTLDNANPGIDALMLRFAASVVGVL